MQEVLQRDNGFGGMRAQKCLVSAKVIRSGKTLAHEVCYISENVAKSILSRGGCSESLDQSSVFSGWLNATCRDAMACHGKLKLSAGLSTGGIELEEILELWLAGLDRGLRTSLRDVSGCHVMQPGHPP